MLTVLGLQKLLTFSHSSTLKWWAIMFSQRPSMCPSILLSVCPSFLLSAHLFIILPSVITLFLFNNLSIHDFHSEFAYALVLGLSSLWLLLSNIWLFLTRIMVLLNKLKKFGALEMRQKLSCSVCDAFISVNNIYIFFFCNTHDLNHIEWLAKDFITGHTNHRNTGILPEYLWKI